jgi:hypothetical protein
MCFELYLGAECRLPLSQWETQDRRVYVESLTPETETVKSHFTQPEVVYVGSSLCCGCGFRSVSLQNGEWPEEFLIESGDGIPPDDHVKNHRELFDLVMGLLDRGVRIVELYGCWSGDEQEQTEHHEEIPATRLLDDKFWFRERVLYRISGFDQCYDDELRRIRLMAS